jgi:type VI secretion system secreted protein Hcp
MAFQPYMSVKSARQGQFKGEALQQQRKDKWIPVLALNMSLKSPHDAATGQPSGKRQYEPVVIVKEWGAASPQGLTACATNENLTEVMIEFMKINSNGEEYIYQTVKLTDAMITEVARFTAGAPAGTPALVIPPTADTHEIERWSFTFRKIEIEDFDGGTTFVDDWSNVG